MNTVLVIQTASIGDVILATTVVEKLHRVYPGAAIDLLVKKGNESLFDGHPFLHDILVWDKSRNKYAGLYRLARRIRKTRYDLVVNVQRFASTGLLTALSGAEMTIGFDKNPFSFFFTKKIKHRIEPNIHEVSRNLDLVSEITDREFTGPRLYSPASLPAAVIGELTGGRIYTFSPASL